MRVNPMRAAVERGEVQYGTWINMSRNPSVLALLQAAGLNFARVDMEHSSPSMETLADMAILARALEFPIVVRPPAANREWITRLLDAGVFNIHCPQVDTAEQAAEIVAASRYAPMGSRGMLGRGPGTDFEAGGLTPERLAFTNQQVFITVMLECGSAFDHLEAIAAMDGIDAITIGPTDLAQDLGVYGTPEMGRVLDEHRHRVLDTCKRHGKVCAMLAGSAKEARYWRDAGALLLGYASDVDVMLAGYRSFIAEVNAG